MRPERIEMPNGDEYFKCSHCQYVCYKTDSNGVQIGDSCSELIINVKDPEFRCKLDRDGD